MTSKITSLLRLSFTANTLKRIPRVGWGQRGVADVESVAEHSFGVAFLALLLADAIHEPLDRERLLTLALLHDLAESQLTDLPHSAIRFLGAETKRRAEEEALAHVLEGHPRAQEYLALWREFEDRTTPEGRLIRDADKLEMMIQALVYERATGNRELEEFWQNMDEYPWAYPLSREIFERLWQMREE